VTQEAQRLCDLLGLTGHDGRLLDAIRRGRRNAEIAVELGIKTGTVKSRTFHLYDRLDVDTRVQAALLAERALVGDKLRLAEEHALEQRHTVVATILGEVRAYLSAPQSHAVVCPCQTDEEPGPHLPTCPWADPEYDGAIAP
jgi:DNA-binding CsgD family transcriptional regulator